MSRWCLAAIACLLIWPEPSRADSMDPSLSRLRVPPGKGGCPASGPFCPDEEAYERLVADLAVGLSPAVNSGAASLGLRGFSLRVSVSVTPIAGDRHWAFGTEGPNGAASSHNAEPQAALAWNRLEVRKGLPFGLEIGGTVGHGFDTSLWLIGGELRVALFEGYRSGLGALPDVAVRGVVQSLLGSPEISLHTLTFDVTLSKPYVVAGRHRLTPLVALQALFANAKSGSVDLTPDVSAWDSCASLPTSASPSGFECSASVSEADRENTRRFASLHQTRIRLFLGLEEQYGWLTSALTLGFDLTVPRRHADTTEDGVDGDLPRSVTLHFALGLRY